jgi:hypothetical protein
MCVLRRDFGNFRDFRGFRRGLGKSERGIAGSEYEEESQKAES